MSSFGLGALSAAGGGGYSASSGANVSNANHSVNILGSQGSFDINQYLQNANGPAANGGWTGAVSPPGFSGGIALGGGISSSMLLLGGVALIAVFLLVRR